MSKKMTKMEKALNSLMEEDFKCRKKLIDEIQMCLAIVQCFIKKQNQSHFFDINTTCEYVFCEVLNLVYEIKLIDLNTTLKTNFPAIDLGDKKLRICYQITAQNDIAKIKQTIHIFQELKLYEQYDKLRFLLLSPKKRYQSIDYMRGSYNMLITDIDDLSHEISCLRDHIKMESIITLLKREIINLDIIKAGSLDDYISKIIPIPQYGDNYNKLLGELDVENKSDYIKMIYEFIDILMKYSKDIRIVIFVICLNKYHTHIGLNCKKGIYFSPEKICRELHNVIPFVGNILKELVMEKRICPSDYLDTYILDFTQREYGINILLEIMNVVSRENSSGAILKDIIVDLDFRFLDNNDNKHL